eukprot:scaffold2639_cov95-Isochrysis_galbana.AAC.10
MASVSRTCTTAHSALTCLSPSTNGRSTSSSGRRGAGSQIGKQTAPRRSTAQLPPPRRARRCRVAPRHPASPPRTPPPAASAGASAGRTPAPVVPANRRGSPLPSPQRTPRPLPPAPPTPGSKGGAAPPGRRNGPRRPPHWRRLTSRRERQMADQGRQVRPSRRLPLPPPCRHQQARPRRAHAAMHRRRRRPMPSLCLSRRRSPPTSSPPLRAARWRLWPSRPRRPRAGASRVGWLRCGPPDSGGRGAPPGEQSQTQTTGWPAPPQGRGVGGSGVAEWSERGAGRGAWGGNDRPRPSYAYRVSASGGRRGSAWRAGGCSSARRGKGTWGALPGRLDLV